MSVREKLHRNDQAGLYGLNLDRVEQPLLICFSSWSERPSIEAEGFAEVFCKKYGYRSLFVVPATNDWYQSRGSEKAVSVAANLASEASRVIVYGSSMGGYGALNYAAALGADVALAVIPQYSIDGKKVPFEKRWRQDAAAIAFRRDPISASSTSGCRAYVVYDPFFEPDRKHAELIQDSGAAELVKLPFIGHSGPGGSVLGQGLRAAFEQRDVPAALRGTYRRIKKSTAYYYLQLARLPKNLASSDRLKLLARASELAPRDGKIDVATAQELIKSRNWQAAVAYLSEAVQRRPTLSLLWSYLASALGHQKLLPEAIDAANRAIFLVPTNAFYQHQMAGLLARAGRSEEARIYQAEAVRLAPHVPAYLNQLDLLS